MNFDIAFERLIGHEGGYVNHHDDPGGETKYGITKRSYPSEDIKNLTLEQAKAIYLRDFWEPLGDEHPAVKFQAFDLAVNSGVSRAQAFLVEAKQTASDPAGIILAFNALRLQFYTDLRTWGSFGKGWTRRIAGNLRLAAEDLA